MRIKKISLHNLSEAEMAKREQNSLRGGVTVCSCTCICQGTCGCLYEGEKEGEDDSYYGGSSTYDNGYANSGITVDYLVQNTARGLHVSNLY